jgi:hypothetical protein
MGDVVVTACVRCHSLVEPDDLRCAVCAAATPGAARAASTETVTVLRCKGCGAAVSYDAAKQAPCCAFCGATMQVEQTSDPLQQAQYVLPFTVDEGRARTALDGFLRSGGFFHPGDLAVASGVSAMQPLFYASWIFDAEADVAYATDSDYGNGRSRWAPHAGVARMVFERVAVSASRGLTAEETRALLPGYDLGTARDVAHVETAGPQGASAERFELERSAARSVVASAIANDAEQRVRSGIAPGSTFRNTHVSLVLRGLHTRRVLLPVWILTYTYGEKPYRVVVHGQRADIVVGKRPLSIARVLGVALGVVALVFFALVVFGLLAR